MLATFTVTNDDDAIVNTPAAVGTLRQAIFDANQLDDADEIRFSTNPAHGLNGGTILLDEGELSITKGVTIDARCSPAVLRSTPRGMTTIPT